MNKGKKIGPRRNGGYHHGMYQTDASRMRLGVGAEMHDTLNRNSLAYKEGVRKLAAWHKECARRRMVAAMTPEERDEYLRKEKS